MPVVPDIYFSWDTQNGTVSAELDRAEGGLLRTRLDITGRPAWLTLNIELGRLRFREGGSFGMLIETGPQNARDGHPIGMFPFIRSSDAEGGYQDTALRGDLLLGKGRGIWSLTHWVRSHDPMAAAGAYHTLVLPLPRRSLVLDIRDLKLF